MRNAIPSFITSLNISCGFVAILLNDPFWSPLVIVLGAVFDLFDGMVARMLKATSAIGKDLDSLADLVSFGVAPAYLFFHHVTDQSIAALIAVTFIPVFSAIRLAIFNNDTTQTKDFKGLATPSNAIFFISLPLVLHVVDDQWLHTAIQSPFFIYSVPLVFSGLLVSKLRMFSFKGLGDGFKKNPLPFVFIGLILLLAPFTRWLTFPLSIIVYIMLSVIYHFTRKAPSTQ